MKFKKWDKSRYVIFSDEHGVMQEHGPDGIYWSITNSRLSSAITFANEEEAKVYADEAKKKFPNFPEYRMVEVIPDLPHNRVSREACAKRLLPWNDAKEFIQN